MTNATKLVAGATVLAGTLALGGLQASAANQQPGTPANNIQRVHQLTIDEQIEANPVVQSARHNVTTADKTVQTALDDQKQQRVAQKDVDQQLVKAQANLAMRQRAGKHMHELSVEANTRQIAAKSDLTKKQAILDKLQSESRNTTVTVKKGQPVKSEVSTIQIDLKQAQADVKAAKAELANATIEVSGSAIDDRYAQGELKSAQEAVAKAQMAVDHQQRLSTAANVLLAQAQQHLTERRTQLTIARTNVRATLTNQQPLTDQSTATKPATNEQKISNKADNKEITSSTGTPEKQSTNNQKSSESSNFVAHESTPKQAESTGTSVVRPHTAQSVTTVNRTAAKPVTRQSVQPSMPVKTLPQTDEATDKSVTALGLILIGLTGWLGLKRRNRKWMVR